MSRFKKEKLGVYGIYFMNENGVDDCLYVGRGELSDRKTYHWSRCKHQKHGNKKLQEHWNQYDGKNTWEFRVLEYCNKKDYKELEQHYVDICKPMFNNYKASSFTYNTNTAKKKKTKEQKNHT